MIAALALATSGCAALEHPDLTVGPPPLAPHTADAPEPDLSPCVPTTTAITVSPSQSSGRVALSWAVGDADSASWVDTSLPTEFGPQEVVTRLAEFSTPDDWQAAVMRTAIADDAVPPEWGSLAVLKNPTYTVSHDFSTLKGVPHVRVVSAPKLVVDFSFSCSGATYAGTVSAPDTRHVTPLELPCGGTQAADDAVIAYTLSFCSQLN